VPDRISVAGCLSTDLVGLRTGVGRDLCHLLLDALGCGEGSLEDRLGGSFLALGLGTCLGEDLLGFERCMLFADRGRRPRGVGSCATSRSTDTGRVFLRFGEHPAPGLKRVVISACNVVGGLAHIENLPLQLLGAYGGNLRPLGEAGHLTADPFQVFTYRLGMVSPAYDLERLRFDVRWNESHRRAPILDLPATRRLPYCYAL